MIICDITHSRRVAGTATLAVGDGEPVRLDLSAEALEALSAGDWLRVGQLARSAVRLPDEPDTPAVPVRTGRPGRPRKAKPAKPAAANTGPVGQVGSDPVDQADDPERYDLPDDIPELPDDIADELIDFDVEDPF